VSVSIFLINVTKIEWSDETNFELSGHVNRHNCVYWDVTNPQIMSTVETALNQPGVSMWGMVILISCP
jgi:hypothetical protein